MSAPPFSVRQDNVAPITEDLASSSSPRSSTISTRIDSAHPVSGDLRPGPEDATVADIADPQIDEVVDAIVGKQPHLVGEQINRQASELAAHLQAQRRSLDHREAEYNSRVAQMENELRVARLLVREREQELAERELELDQPPVELNGSATGTSDSLPGNRPAKSSPDGAGAEPSWASDQWKARQQLVERTEAVLSEQLSELNQRRERLEADRRTLEDRVRTDRQQLQRAQDSTHADTQKKLQALEQRRRAVEKRHAAVERLYSETARMHRESLEMRLCTQQLWADLTGVASQPELTQKLGQLRRALADHFRLASESLARQQNELHELLARLGKQQKKIQEQRAQLQQWVARRQAELEEEAGRLVSRQQQLDRDEAEVRRQREQWDGQRREYQQEIRRLMSELRQTTAARIV